MPFFRWKVHGHIFGVLCMVMFVILQLGPPMLLLFASADLLAAVWTGLALRYPRRSALERAAGDFNPRLRSWKSAQADSDRSGGS